MHRSIARLRRRHRTTDEGFTLIELAVASGIMLFILTAMAYATTVGFVDIGYARQRQAATGLANETIEIVRSLPKADLERGLDATDLANSADPNITTGGTSPETYYFRGETIPYGPNTPVVPLVPHQQQRTASNSRYDISLYLTNFRDEAGVEQKDVIRVTVLVEWNPIRKGTTGMVEAQSIIYFPVGCQSPSTHPFAAPCEPAFYGNATTGPGETRIEGTISGVPLRDVVVSVGEESSDLQTEQVISVQGFGRTPGATLRYSDPTMADETAGRLQVTTSSSNNPTENRPPYDSQVASQSAGEKSKLSSSGNGIKVNAGAATVTSVSTIAANSATQPCPHSSSQTDNLPCGWGFGSQGSALEARLVLAGSDHPAVMMSVATASSSVLTNKDACTNDGCIAATATRTLGDTTFGGLPSGATAPALWEGYLVKITNYTATATAQSGYDTAAPSTTISAVATIRYWNGLGYTDMLVPSGASSVNIPVASVTAGDTKITATLATGTTSTTSESGCSGGCRARGEARVTSPIIGTLTYTVGTTANLTMTIDLGTLSAKTAYAPSPGI